MGAYMVFGNNWFIMRYLKEGDVEKAAAYVAWMMRTHKAYGIKCVNPAGVENWGWAKNVRGLDEPNIHFEVTPRELIRGLAEVNEMLGLPMSLHLHANNLGHPGNWEIARDSLMITSGSDPKNKSSWSGQRPRRAPEEGRPSTWPMPSSAPTAAHPGGTFARAHRSWPNT